MTRPLAILLALTSAFLLGVACVVVAVAEGHR